MPAATQNTLPFGPQSGIARTSIEWHKTIRVAVSGDVRLTRAEVGIIDTPDFQRLRRIQQLGTSSWVYPTALHTRFDHSLGVLAVVDDMIVRMRDALRYVTLASRPEEVEPQLITESQRILARLYALLHDITHVPFGHTLEDELKIFDSHDEFQKSVGEKRGLDRFEQVLGPESDIGKVIRGDCGEGLYERFRNIYLRGKFDRLEVEDAEGRTADEFVYYLVSDTVCADLIDYLRRDSYFCDLELRIPTRFLNYLYVGDVDVEGAGLRRRVVVRLWKPRDGEPRRDVMTDMVGLLESRYLLAERVYFHHAKVIAGTMIGRSVLEASLAGRLNSQMMLRFGDETLLAYLARLGDEKGAGDQELLSARLAIAARDRVLYESLKRYVVEDFHGHGGEEPFNDLIKAFESAAKRRQIENEIALIAGARPGDILLYVASPKMNRKIAEAIVDYKGKRCLLRTVNSEPLLQIRLDTIGKAHERLWRANVFVHPEVDDARRKIAQLAFEAKFFGRDLAEGKYEQLLISLAAEEESFKNHGLPETYAACKAAAADLVSARPRAAHGRATRQYLLDALRERL
ncbi:hypothetical protein SAMN06265365_11729 [Tistlia consotensis]|uniref:HD/PDEase domain-containing protein n=1 Tax=Tistlia consotensis USBA 355 TaxID=560819 RepID=A0A1Y6C8X7_9PROT|nr:HD domain-containing protein [Tistlia consotensis]SMF52063.1 hypothetical protein SAMN05428998_11890 [Tistlia consotensis USBA 355]SNR83403.1 hypothetical protein SAMN06265365_11729 [Tistlia consotensis]